MRRGQPLYLDLAERLAHGITEKRYRVGSLLPTEAELCAQFDVSRFTVREAVKQLQISGLVATHRGIGTEVVAAKPMAGRFSYAFDSVPDFIHSARQTRLTKIVATDVAADKTIAEALKREKGYPVLRIQAVRVLLSEKGRALRPIALVDVYVPGEYGGIREDLKNLDTTLNLLIEQRYGIQTARVEQTVEPCMVDAAQAEALSVRPGSLGISFTRLYVNDRGHPFEYVRNIQAGEDARLTMTMRSTGR